MFGNYRRASKTWFVKRQTDFPLDDVHVNIAFFAQI